jgi:hypothetical protein
LQDSLAELISKKVGVARVFEAKGISLVIPSAPGRWRWPLLAFFHADSEGNLKTMGIAARIFDRSTEKRDRNPQRERWGRGGFLCRRQPPTITDSIRATM